MTEFPVLLSQDYPMEKAERIERFFYAMMAHLENQRLLRHLRWASRGLWP